VVEQDRSELAAAPHPGTAKLSREDHMIDGAWVPVIAIGILAVNWIVVLYGSRYFGPKT
jgi:hypothetical protein